MQIKAMKEVKNCLDGLYVKEVLFSNAVSKEFLDYLGKYGKFEYKYNFPKPLYKFKIDNKLVIKGMLGKSNARITLSKNTNGEVDELFSTLVQNYHNDLTVQYI